MSFPISPANNQVTTVNGIRYVYNSTKNAWRRSLSIVTGDMTFQGNLLLNSPTVSYNANAAMPKSYTDTISIVFGS
jgi:hypothetical protein